MTWFKRTWGLSLLVTLLLVTTIFSWLYYVEKHKLDYRPGETYIFPLSNVGIDLWGDNLTVIYRTGDIVFIKQEADK